MTHLHLVRHAHADWVPDEGRPLSARGRRDASRVAEILAPLGVAAIYSSPARRAIETVEPLADRAGLRPTLVDELRERELSTLAGGEFEAVVAASWRQPGEAIRGAESLVAAQARGLGAVRRVLSRHPDGPVVVSTHGNLLALVVSAFDSRYGYDFWRRLTFPDIYELRIEGATLRGIRRRWHEAGREPGTDDAPTVERGPDVEARVVTGGGELEEIRKLFVEYAEWVRIDLSFQGFAEELAGLPREYVAPTGTLLLCLVDGAAAGCVAVRRWHGDACEMKRLFVRPAFRGSRCGLFLAERAIAWATGAGYRRMVLDTLPTMASAQRLYERLGFRDIGPYRFNPVPGARFMERELTA